MLHERNHRRISAQLVHGIERHTRPARFADGKDGPFLDQDIVRETVLPVRDTVNPGLLADITRKDQNRTSLTYDVQAQVLWGIPAEQ